MGGVVDRLAPGRGSIVRRACLAGAGLADLEVARADVSPRAYRSVSGMQSEVQASAVVGTELTAAAGAGAGRGHGEGRPWLGRGGRYAAAGLRHVRDGVDDEAVATNDVGWPDQRYERAVGGVRTGRPAGGELKAVIDPGDVDGDGVGAAVSADRQDVRGGVEVEHRCSESLDRNRHAHGCTLSAGQLPSTGPRSVPSRQRVITGERRRFARSHLQH